MSVQYLENQWKSLGPAFDTPGGGSVLEALEKRYSARNRHYHNLNHLESMFHLYDRHRETLQAPEVVAHSIFWHDTIYKVSRKDNELQSAKLSAQILPGMGVAAAVISQVEVFIEATKSHLLSANSHPDLAWLLDFDLAILGAEWGDYEIYTKQIRKEYRIYPDLLYRPGRLKVLAHFLKREHLFHTETFRQKYESRARMNLAREMDTLK